MKSEASSITSDEWLLRRIWHERFFPRISPNAFLPRTKGRDIDEHGISLFRLSCLNSPSDILVTMDSEKRLLTGIVQIPVSKLFELGIQVVSDPIPDILGHVLIPEISSTTYTNDKLQIIQLMKQLADMANEEGNQLIIPSSKTT
ncbi:MAG: hypothetical protein R3B84_23585 [Zavarzinella sp.]